ncbi:MAG TPA: Zn-dependent hydrolase [Baekduia sp.]|uniref:Zn-dependent hydrolase n=1 Tax=Baekduia sp. TaxID=2600305 RepID=UPI002D782B08|nr:Zn-dependent hydrolase [Baekduia sp.]HET6506911.1 Zn-dependent hydrolase [Baekduia sp.]
MSPITARDLDARLAPLRAIGFDARRGTNRLAWTPEDAAAGAWFEEQAAACGLEAWRDAAGNRWATPRGTDGPWWAVGSHTDSVRDGGAFDGALGVAAAFAIAAVAPDDRPLAVISFEDEEGARFNTPTFGSRALTGALADGVLDRADDDGTTLAEAMRAAGVDPAGLPRATDNLDKLRGFYELHIDQSTDLAERGAPYGVVSSLAARLRVRATLRGVADHAGTTPMEGRQDALLAAARLIVAANEQAAGEMRATVGRILVEPNALTAIAAGTTAWLDARSPDSAVLDAWLARVTAAAPGADLAIESRSPAVTFDDGLRALLRGAGAPEVVCWAGHDAGLLAPHVPAAMVLVRNATGISHSPVEHVELEDAAAGATAILEALSA